MGVEVIGVVGETNGYGDSMDAFREAHNGNSRILVNLMNGRKKNDFTPPYDPRHPDNQWPKMMYHPAKGELIVGKALIYFEPGPFGSRIQFSLGGETRKQTEEDNLEAVKEAQINGYRAEPYLKPQIAVLDPAVEKAALLAKNQELEGKVTAANDLIQRMEARLSALEHSEAPRGKK